MKKTKIGLLALLLTFLSACANIPYNASKPEMSVQEGESSPPPKTFNQLYNEWEY